MRNATWIANLAGSVVAAIALGLAYLSFHSELALAQAADSVSDVLTGTLLVWAARAAAAPPDEGHPLGHGRAEPIAALVVAVLASVLAVQVLRDAVGVLAGGELAVLDWPIAAVFAFKVVFKTAIATSASRLARGRPSPVLTALGTDARNDAVVGIAALIGFAISRAGWPQIDPILAIAVAIYVGVSSIRLARASVDYLLGTAAPADRCQELAAIVRANPAARDVPRMVAVSHGAALHVEVQVAVDGSLRVDEAHRIAQEIEQQLRAEPDVAHAVVRCVPGR